MESFILLFKHCRFWVGQCPGLLVGLLLLLTQQGWAQIYSTYYTTPKLQYLDLATQTWTNKTAPPLNLRILVAYQGKLYAEPMNSNKFYEYNPVTDTWTEKAPKIGSNYYSGEIEVAGDYIYYSVNNSVNSSSISFLRYDIKSNTWTQLPSAPSKLRAEELVYDGGDYIYCATFDYNIPGPLLRYSISANSWVTMPTPVNPASLAYDGMAFKNGKLYFCTSLNNSFYSYDPITTTYTSLANTPDKDWVLTNGDGNYLYSASSTGIHRYDISTNTWTNLPTVTSNSLVYMGPSCSLTGTVTATPATCATAGGVNANAALTLMTSSGGPTKVGYSLGSSYTGPAFSAATAVTTAPMVLSNTLPNPSVPQPYTIRLFQDATCYKDVVATLTPTLCLTSDLSLSVSPATQSGSKGELLTYTLTMTNAGPDAASNVKVDVKVPTNATLLTASPQLGTYSNATHKWEVSSLPVGSQTLTVTLKMN